MKSVIDCPRCNGRVTAPAGMFEHTLVRCPHCKGEYEFKEALQYAPPELEVIGTAAATVTKELKFDESMFGDSEFNLAPDYAKSESADEEVALTSSQEPELSLEKEEDLSEAAVFKISADDLEPMEEVPMPSAEAPRIEDISPAAQQDAMLDEMLFAAEPAAIPEEPSNSRQVDLEETVAFGFDGDGVADENPPEVEAEIESALTGEPVGVPDDAAFDFLDDGTPASGNASLDDEPVAMRMDTDADLDDMFAPVSEESLGDASAQTEMMDDAGLIEDVAAEAEPTMPVEPVVAKGKKGKAAEAPGAVVPGLPKQPKKKRSLVSLILGILIGFPLAAVIFVLGSMWAMSEDYLGIAGILPQAIVPPSLRLKDTAVAKVPTPDSQPDTTDDNEPANENEPVKEATPSDNSNQEIKSRSERIKDEEVKEAAAESKAPMNPSAPPTEIPGAAPTDPTKTVPSATEPDKAVPPTEAPKEDFPSLDKPITVEPMVPIGNDPFAQPETQPKPEQKSETPKPDAPAPMPTTPADPFAIDPVKPAEPEPDTPKSVEPAKPIDPTGADPFATPAPMPSVEPTNPAEPAKETTKDAAPASSEPAKIADPAPAPVADPFATPMPDPVVTPMPEPAKPAAPEVSIVALTSDKKFGEADLAAVVKKVKEQPDFTAESDAGKKTQGKMMTYRNLAELGEATSFVNTADNPGKIVEQLNAATDVLKDIVKSESTMTELGVLSQLWLAAKTRTSNGIFIAGQVQQSAARGKLFVSQVELPGKTPMLIEVVSSSELKKGPIGLLGAIVDRPTVAIPNYEGTDQRVIWASVTAGQ